MGWDKKWKRKVKILKTEISFLAAAVVIYSVKDCREKNFSSYP